MSQFVFLQAEWPELFDPAARAESLIYPDSRSACFHAQRASLTELDLLLASLQHRAFRGEL